MAWITPIVDWDISDYYNYSDLNRVENNTDYLADLVETYFSTVAVTGINTSRDNTDILFYDDMNRIENNILLLKTATFIPIGWQTPKTNWKSLDAFDYNVANRLESNLLALKTMLDEVISGLLYCGDSLTTICGKGNTLF